MRYESPDCPLILAGAMAGKSGYTACRTDQCAWWDREHSMCCIVAAAVHLAGKEKDDEQ